MLRRIAISATLVLSACANGSPSTSMRTGDASPALALATSEPQMCRFPVEGPEGQKPPEMLCTSTTLGGRGQITFAVSALRGKGGTDFVAFADGIRPLPRVTIPIDEGRRTVLKPGRIAKNVAVTVWKQRQRKPRALTIKGIRVRGTGSWTLSVPRRLLRSRRAVVSVYYADRNFAAFEFRAPGG